MILVNGNYCSDFVECAFVCRAENRIAGWEYSPVDNLPSRCLLRLILSTDIKVSILSFTDRLHTLCSQKSDAKIQITITTAYLIRIKYFLSGFNYHLSDVTIANFNKIYRTVSEQ